MPASVQSLALHNGKETVIDVECSLSNGLPSLIIVGFASKAIDESKERVRSAFQAINLTFPKKRIVINLAPSDIPKESSAYDLPIAASILLAHGSIEPNAFAHSLLIGELGLDGTIRPVRGVIGYLLAAQKCGYKRLFIPAGNLPQAKLVPGLELVPVAHLKDLYLHASGTLTLPVVKTDGNTAKVKRKANYVMGFEDVVGQKRAKRALQIAAAGGHNILLSGPPGTGKSMLAKALPSILPDMSDEEILETTYLHSLGLDKQEHIVHERPFRSPHHTSSQTAIIGGGQNPRPGEISLSHNGVLLFDEFPEFTRSCLEALRQPLEDGTITVSRAKTTATYPARFVLVATANPCPCGNYGSQRMCECSQASILKYQQRLSGPIIDRIDLYIDVDEVPHDQLLKDNGGAETSNSIKTVVNKARDVQASRFGKTRTNASMNNREIKRHCQLTTEAAQLLDTAAAKLQLSARGYMRLLKVCRTIADLENKENIDTSHITEALQYRRK